MINDRACTPLARTSYGETMTTSPRPTRESRQEQTREAIRHAAIALFVDHGFDAVAVADIAERAGVSRSTFFRHFPDKADVLFHDDSGSHLLLARAIAGAARSRAPLGDSLRACLEVLHSALLVLADTKAIQAIRYPALEQLIASTPQLQACSLVKERGYTDVMVEALIDQGAEPLIARQAGHVATACYDSGYTEAFHDPEQLSDAVDRAFRRLFALA
ncbi:transcriptional regulator, TetR family [Kibdelosporangium aridum]|uniref:Transcriptional regulator, TetR family n=2 Tax=Kibdelosporangium aridum TaxID=2030 RepID=A0A1Y5Y774_KIBAR|nr:transcriptional regulator, TetR family [Kibdelosporangium aridum]